LFGSDVLTARRAETLSERRIKRKQESAGSRSEEYTGSKTRRRIAEGVATRKSFPIMDIGRRPLPCYIKKRSRQQTDVKALGEKTERPIEKDRLGKAA